MFFFNCFIIFALKIPLNTLLSLFHFNFFLRYEGCKTKFFSQCGKNISNVCAKNKCINNS